MPSLENLHQHFKDKPFVLLSINVRENKNDLQDFANNKLITFKPLLDEDGNVSNRYGVRSHPVKFLIDMKGNLIGTSLGYNEWDTDEMKSLINLLIDSEA